MEVLGISVAKEFRGEGVGSFNGISLKKKRKKNFPTLKIVTLEVYSKNAIAKRIYETFAFIEYGKLPNGIMR